MTPEVAEWLASRRAHKKGRGAATGRAPDEVLTDAVGRQLRADALDDVLVQVRLEAHRREALALSYVERDAARAERLAGRIDL